jgi:hypothetical protein
VGKGYIIIHFLKKYKHKKNLMGEKGFFMKPSGIGVTGSCSYKIEYNHCLPDGWHKKGEQANGTPIEKHIKKDDGSWKDEEEAIAELKALGSDKERMATLRKKHTKVRIDAVKAMDTFCTDIGRISGYIFVDEKNDAIDHYLELQLPLQTLKILTSDETRLALVCNNKCILPKYMVETLRCFDGDNFKMAALFDILHIYKQTNFPPNVMFDILCCFNLDDKKIVVLMYLCTKQEILINESELRRQFSSDIGMDAAKLLTKTQDQTTPAKTSIGGDNAELRIKEIDAWIQQKVLEATQDIEKAFVSQ